MSKTAEGIPSRLERRRTLERGLVRVRWFGAAFAFFQVFMSRDPACPPGAVLRELTNKITHYTPGCDPSFVKPTGYALAAGLALLNVGILFALRRARSDKGLARLGVAAFLADHLFLIGFTWMYSYTLESAIWVILYIAPLEGALRWRMNGALLSLGILAVAETGRDFFRLAMWGYQFHLVPDTTFRVGIMTIIGLVAGMLASHLERERKEVERRADEASALAASESQARQEVEAFHMATIAGVSTGDLGEAFQRMMVTIGGMLGYESLSIAFIEDHGSEQVLRVAAGYNYPREAVGRTVSLEEGISGPVARTGTPALVNDVRAHPTYLDWANWCRSEMVVPLKVGTRIIGVLNVESPRENAFNEEDLRKFVKLSVPVAVVVENARILAKEREAVERLTELDEMKSDFIAITSHELRTPLTSVLGFIKTMRRPGIDLGEEDRANYLEIIERHGERLLEIVEDLLFVSQIEQGAIEVRRFVFDMRDLAAEVIGTRFADQSHRIRVGSDEELRIADDRDRIRRVFVTLIDNAIKFSPPAAPIKITLTREAGSVVLVVEDEGIGIPQEELGRIFDRFHQVGGSMRRAKAGFGLGLYITKRIVDSLGGKISVSSEPGMGSKFQVRLPAADQAEAHPEAS